MNIKAALFVVLSTLFLVACGQDKAETTSQSATSGTVDRSQTTEKADTTQAVSKAKFQAGTHYKVIDQPLDVEAGHLLEFYWYGCPHCHELDPLIQDYAEKNDAVTLVQVHSSIPQWSMDADVYWSLRGLGEEKRLHKAYMSTRQNGNLTDPEERKTWLAALGADADAMNKALVSDEIMAERKKYAEIEKRVALGGVPAVLVSGKYAIKFDELKSWEHLIEIADWLIENQP